ncbi:MAG: DMT family transporter [Promethearchaeota archaeon]
MGSVVIALSFGIISYSLLNIGLVLEKKGASELPLIETKSLTQNIKNFLSNKIWLLGVSFTIIQYFFYMVAVQQGSLSVVSPMMGVGLIVLVLFSHYYLKEEISKTEIMAILIIITGVVSLGITSKSEEATYTISQINTIFSSGRSIIFNTIIIIIIVAPSVFSVMKKYYKADVIFGFVSGVLGGMGGVFTKGFMAGLSIDTSSSDMNLIINSILNGLSNWTVWIYLIMALSVNGLSMVLQQIGFQKGKATTVSTLFSVLALITPVLAGIIIFQDWLSLSIGIIGIKIISLILIGIGVAILSFYSSMKDMKDINTPNVAAGNENEQKNTE